LFEEIFKKIQSKNREIKVIGVWGKDGLELDKMEFFSLQNVNLELVGAEIADIISRLNKIKTSPESYYMKLNFDEYLLFVFKLTKDFFLITLTGKEIIKGKLFFYIDIYKNKLISFFS
jgi:predicted regulator of Ras-like GTPase activity (Roadblock/LC7/MglB family)